jgi:type I restriction enzyme M protein
MSKLTLQKIETFIWGATSVFRGAIDPSETRSYLLGVLFLKFLSDEFEEEQERVVETYVNQGKSQADAEKIASEIDAFEDIFFIPECARWKNLAKHKHDIGCELNKATHAIEDCNTSLNGVLTSIDFQNRILPDKTLIELLAYFSQHRLRREDFESPTVLGDAYEYLITKFAESSGKNGGEFATPTELRQLMVSLLNPKPGMSVYDPAAGSGALLIESEKFVTKNTPNAVGLSLFGQEINSSTYAILKQNIIINGIFDADIKHGDTLGHPLHIEDDQLMTFDIVISNPPFGMGGWGRDKAEVDPYQRYPYGIPSKQNADFAFMQHMIASLDAKGRMGIVVPNGVLFRGGKDRDILRGIIQDDLVEAIIELPSSLFYGTGIPTIVLILNKNKIKSRQNEILCVLASEDYERSKFRNKLKKEDISKIIRVYENWTEQDNFSKIVSKEALGENDFDLGRILKDIKFEQRTSLLNTSYKEYRRHKLKDIAQEIVSLRSNSNEEDEGAGNNIYLPRTGNFVVVSNRVSTKVKDDNLYRISIDAKIADADYLTVFFQSEFGRECIRKETSGSLISSLSLASLENIPVAIPSLEEQEKIIDAASKMQLIRRKVDEIDHALKSNPLDDQQSDTLDAIISSVTDLSLDVSPLLCEESIVHEFKASLRTPFPDYPEPFVNEQGQQNYKIGKSIFKSKGEIHNYFENIVLKTIASFLNTRGGTLVIGVHEYGNEKEIVGVDREGFESSDAYERHLIQKLNNAFGAVAVSRYVTVETVKISDLSLCVVRCDEDTGEEIFYLNDVVYVRTGPRIDKLSTKDVVELSKSKVRKSS